MPADPSFQMDATLARRGVAGCYSLLLGLTQEGADLDAIGAYVDGVVAAARKRATRAEIVADPVLAGYHALHRAFDVPTRKLFSAPETLIRLIEKRGDLPRIGPVVDLYNAVSVETGLALGAHDLAGIEGDIALRFTDGSEAFHPVGATQPEAVRPGEYAYIDVAANEVICRLEVRQVEKTKVTPATRDLFLIVQGNPATPPEFIKTGHDRLVGLLQSFFGGRHILLSAT